MKELLHSSDQLYPILLVGICLICGLVACHSNKENKLLLNTQDCTSAEWVQLSINRFVQSINSPDFSPSSPKITFAAESDFPYLKEGNNSPYIPAALWKVYALTGKAEWKELAEKYTQELGESKSPVGAIFSSALLHVYLARYSALKGDKHRTSLLHALSISLAKEESDNDTIHHVHIVEHNRLEKLLENELLFYASQETGDPIYSQVAKKNSDEVFDYFFQNSNSERSYIELLDDKRKGLDEVLSKLSTKDFYNLSLIFYGFTILNEEENNERYHSLCKRLAKLFVDLFAEKGIKPSTSKNHRAFLDQKVKALPRVWIALALNNLNRYSGNYYKQISTKIICQMLDLEIKQGKEKVDQFSPRLYYYLLTYFNLHENL